MLSVLLSKFAEDSGPAVHITPGELFTFQGYSITNSMFYAIISSLFIIILFTLVRWRMTVKPKGGIVQLVEVGTEFIISLIESGLGSRKKAVKYAPYFVTIFFFILMTNWLGLLPGVGEAITYNEVPVFRPFTADLSGTLAAATVTMVFVQYFAIKESGLVPHLKHYFNGSFLNPMTWFLGIFEMFGELTRIASLALRLFLNVAIGEIIIAVFSYLGKNAAPLTSLPFVTLELFVGALQAYIFVMLSVMYLSVAVKHHAEHEAEDHETGSPKPLVA